MDDEFYADDFDDDEVIENAILCPTCEDVTGHQILKEKEIRLLDFVFACLECHVQLCHRLIRLHVPGPLDDR